eukprot:CAMPEP_0176183186 /NCGR_PEP_ID=MMETSP0121_2-20121125/155_1 /TAXON_ID=160619 /ORGANISM="Kryptoperidinium foliaceum, Strain CCMP 1326" /LENGTH=33 /DNA_ID= /DNA_START= /DNA_END= /DNA_ORIENTATION=
MCAMRNEAESRARALLRGEAHRCGGAVGCVVAG